MGSSPDRFQSYRVVSKKFREIDNFSRCFIGSERHGSVFVLETIEQTLEHVRESIHLRFHAIHLVLKTILECTQTILKRREMVFHLLCLFDDQTPVTEFHDLTLRITHRGAGFFLCDLGSFTRAEHFNTLAFRFFCVLLHLAFELDDVLVLIRLSIGREEELVLPRDFLVQPTQMVVKLQLTTQIWQEE